MQESLFALRENLLVDQPQSQTNVLVSLTQAAPDGGDSLLVAAVKRLSDRLGITAQQAAHAWVDAYCHQVLKPLFTAEADYGLVLLAHQQNILVQMLGDLPVGLIYRDCRAARLCLTRQAGSTPLARRRRKTSSPVSSCCATSLITCWLTPLCRDRRAGRCRAGQ
ncbi:ferric iron reductase (plasmid) [Klebsiella pneumoniae]|nr:ferric iron reductase [Klebsiella pneumoniae]